MNLHFYHHAPCTLNLHVKMFVASGPLIVQHALLSKLPHPHMRNLKFTWLRQFPPTPQIPHMPLISLSCLSSWIGKVEKGLNN